MTINDYELEVGGRPLAFTFDLAPDRQTDANIAVPLTQGKLYEPAISAVFLAALQPGDHVLDAGAHVGWFTYLAAWLVGPQGRVLAFEPDLDNHARLSLHRTLNGAAHVVLRPQAVSDKPGTATFWINDDNDGGHALWDMSLYPDCPRTRATRRTREVDLVDLDSAARADGIHAPRIIKLDVEGAEMRALVGATGLLMAQPGPLVICEFHPFALDACGGSVGELRALMQSMGYALWVPEADGGLPRMVPDGVEVHQDYICSLLFARPAAVAQTWPRLTVRT